MYQNQPNNDEPSNDNDTAEAIDFEEVEPDNE